MRRAAPAVALAAALAAAPSWAALGDLTLVSRAGDAPANGPSTSAHLSREGRYVAFTSQASNLVAGDTNDAHDVFVRDLVTGEVTLVSRATGASGAIGDDLARGGFVSAGGRYVVFDSEADNLGAASPGQTANVYIRDVRRSTTKLVARNAFSQGVSADGRRVLFSADAGGYTRIYVRDLDARKTTLASRASGAKGAVADDDSYLAAISANGRYVAFDSEADNLGTADPQWNVWVRDLEANRTTLVSGRAGGARPAISATGRYVAFRTNGLEIAVRDLDRRRTRIAGRGGAAAVSADGRRVAFWAAAGVPGPATRVQLHDFKTGTTTPATPAGETVGEDDSFLGDISANGRYVAFYSGFDELSADDDDTYMNVFVRDFGAVPRSDLTRPRITGLRVTGLRLGYSVSERATVRITIERLDGSARTAATLLQKVRRRGRAATALGAKALKPGRYRVTVRASDAAGNRSDARRIGFTVASS